MVISPRLAGFCVGAVATALALGSASTLSLTKTDVYAGCRACDVEASEVCGTLSDVEIDDPDEILDSNQVDAARVYESDFWREDERACVRFASADMITTAVDFTTVSECPSP